MPRPKFRTMFQDKKDWPETIKHLIWMEEHTCNQHGVAYSHHPNCFIREQPDCKHTAKIAFLDIETTGLDADWDVMTCYCLKPAGGKIIEDIITKEEIQDFHRLDKRIVSSVIQAISKFDVVVAHYGNGFDLPFMRTRAVYWDIPFPNHKAIFQADTWKIAKSKLKMSRNGLENLNNLIRGKTSKTRLNFEMKWKVLTGSKEGLRYIIDHCRRDTVMLEQLYDRIKGFVPDPRTSI